jgi:hypothetical protein
MDGLTSVASAGRSGSTLGERLVTYGWPDEETKQIAIRKKRRSSASHASVDLDRVETPTDAQAHAAARIIAGQPDIGPDETRTILDMLGILKQVRGEPDPDRYLAHCFVDRHARTVANSAEV